METCKHEDDKCEYWYMGLCELDNRLNVCPHDPLYKQLQEFGGHISNPNPEFTDAPSGGLIGWICPVCGRGLSPYTDSCPCAMNRGITCGTGTGVPQHGEIISHTNYDNLSSNTYSNTPTFKPPREDKSYV